MLYSQKIMFGLVLSLTAVACMTDEGPPSTQKDSLSELRAKSSAGIHSAKELQSFLQTNSHSALDYLSPEAKQRFLDSLVFAPKGLGSFRTVELKSLPSHEVSEILQLFDEDASAAAITGQAPQVGTDAVHPLNCPAQGYKCAGAGTCSSDLSSICTCTCVSP